MKTYVCIKCRGTNLEWFADAKWNNDSQSHVIIKVRDCWCGDCKEFTSPVVVPLDKWIANGQN